jgi:hypothetical protein
MATAALQEWTTCVFVSSCTPLPVLIARRGFGATTTLSLLWENLAPAFPAHTESDPAIDPAHIRIAQHGDDWNEFLLEQTQESEKRLRAGLQHIGLLGPLQEVEEALTVDLALVALAATAYLFRVGEQVTGCQTPFVSDAWILPT